MWVFQRSGSCNSVVKESETLDLDHFPLCPISVWRGLIEAWTSYPSMESRQTQTSGVRAQEGCRRTRTKPLSGYSTQWKVGMGWGPGGVEGRLPHITVCTFIRFELWKQGIHELLWSWSKVHRFHSHLLVSTSSFDWGRKHWSVLPRFPFHFTFS